MTHETLHDVFSIVDGCIVGSSLKFNGDTWQPVDRQRAKKFMEIAKNEIQMIKDRLRRNPMELMQIPGLSDTRTEFVSGSPKARSFKDKTTVDRLGNLSANFPGIGPSIMVFTHMDQLGFVVRKIEPTGS